MKLFADVGIGLGCFASFVAGMTIALLRLTAILRDVHETGQNDAQLIESSPEVDLRSTIPHPYVGFVLNPRALGVESTAINAFGFPGPTQVVLPHGADTFVVAITGGSVAKAFAKAARTQLIGALNTSLRGTKKIEIVTLAIGGYRQPQQLMACTFALAAGASFDLVLNIDGFNEVALYPAENRQSNSSMLYPRSWYTKMGIDNERKALAAARSLEFDRQLERLNENRLSPRFHYLDRFLVDALFEILQKKQRAAMAAIGRGFNSRVDLELLGPPEKERSDEEMYCDLAAQWFRSSLLLHKVCKANGARYIHLLQPNQYDAGSKTLNREELEVAYDEMHPYRAGVLHGYPRLRTLGKCLRSEGVQFYDASQIFANESSTTYLDSCCHLTELGNEMLAEFLSRIIREVCV